MRRYGLLLVFASSECRAGALSFGRMSCAACPPPRGCSRLVRLRRPTDALDPLRLEDLLVRQRDKGCLSRSCLPTDALDPSTPSPGTSGIAYPLAGHAHVALDPTLPCPRLALAPAGAGALCLPLGDGHAPHRRPSRPRRPPHQVTAARARAIALAERHGQVLIADEVAEGESPLWRATGRLLTAEVAEGESPLRRESRPTYRGRTKLSISK